MSRRCSWRVAGAWVFWRRGFATKPFRTFGKTDRFDHVLRMSKRPSPHGLAAKKKYQEYLEIQKKLRKTTVGIKTLEERIQAERKEFRGESDRQSIQSKRRLTTELMVTRFHKRLLRGEYLKPQEFGKLIGKVCTTSHGVRAAGVLGFTIALSKVALTLSLTSPEVYQHMVPMLAKYNQYHLLNQIHTDLKLDRAVFNQTYNEMTLQQLLNTLICFSRNGAIDDSFEIYEIMQKRVEPPPREEQDDGESTADPTMVLAGAALIQDSSDLTQETFRELSEQFLNEENFDKFSPKEQLTILCSFADIYGRTSNPQKWTEFAQRALKVPGALHDLDFYLSILRSLDNSKIKSVDTLKQIVSHFQTEVLFHSFAVDLEQPERHKISTLVVIANRLLCQHGSDGVAEAIRFVTEVLPAEKGRYHAGLVNVKNLIYTIGTVLLKSPTDENLQMYKRLFDLIESEFDQQAEMRFYYLKLLGYGRWESEAFVQDLARY
eukprot:TRINITY_DN5083_c0_g1_i3.p1 TRINITY_DN5083_c0_g1~~TRINITY_DN5083_c0_g1_i3.p1  ORF type:complete len:490 (-),score=71.35 TRINITY_DN5083_c0_g1_i3:326-1795(-)